MAEYKGADGQVLISSVNRTKSIDAIRSYLTSSSLMIPRAPKANNNPIAIDRDGLTGRSSRTSPRAKLQSPFGEEVQIKSKEKGKGKSKEIYSRRSSVVRSKDVKAEDLLYVPACTTLTRKKNCKK